MCLGRLELVHDEVQMQPTRRRRFRPRGGLRALPSLEVEPHLVPSSAEHNEIVVGRPQFTADDLTVEAGERMRIGTVESHGEESAGASQVRWGAFGWRVGRLSSAPPQLGQMWAMAVAQVVQKVHS